MRIYGGSMLHAVNKQKVVPGELGEVMSFDLGDIPEDVVKEKIFPIFKLLADILAEYKVYLWLTSGYHTENTDNEV